MNSWWAYKKIEQFGGAYQVSSLDKKTIFNIGTEKEAIFITTRLNAFVDADGPVARVLRLIESLRINNSWNEYGQIAVEQLQDLVMKEDEFKCATSHIPKRKR